MCVCEHVRVWASVCAPVCMHLCVCMYMYLSLSVPFLSRKQLDRGQGIVGKQEPGKGGASLLKPGRARGLL